MHLFSGAGGGILADILLGHQPICAVEIDEYCQQVLSSRQKDGCIPWFPIFADVKEFNGLPWRGIVDVVCGGFPCQDISCAGKGKGIDGERSGLWGEMARVVREVGPRFVFVENSPMLTSRGLGRVLGDLASMGYDARWGVLGADDAGAPHRRKRIWILANAYSGRLIECNQEERSISIFNSDCSMANTDSGRCVEPGQRQDQFAGRTEIVGASPNVSDSNVKHDDHGRHGASAVCRERSAPSIISYTSSQGLFSTTQTGLHRCQESSGSRHEQPERLCGDAAGAGLAQREGEPGNDGQEQPAVERTDWWKSEPAVGRVANELADRLDLFRTIKKGSLR